MATPQTLSQLQALSIEELIVGFLNPMEAAQLRRVLHNGKTLMGNLEDIMSAGRMSTLRGLLVLHFGWVS